MTIPELLKELGIRYATHEESNRVSPGWLGLTCPFCHSRKHLLGVNLKYGNWNCWQCGPRSAEDALASLCNFPHFEARKWWREVEKSDRRGERIHHTRRVFNPPVLFMEMTQAHRKFLKGRGFDPDEIIKLWGVSGIGQRGTPYDWKLFIPITLNGIPVSWTTRSVVGKKYLTAHPFQESVPAKYILYGADLARNAVCVCEGPLDAWAIGPGGTATLGLSYTKRQVNQIASFPLRVICFDAEPAAQRRAQKLCAELEMFQGTTKNVVLQSGKDPSRASKSEIEELRRMLK